MPNLQLYAAEDYDGVLNLYRHKQAYGGNLDPSRDTKERLLAVSQQGNLYVVHQEGAVVGTCMVLDNPHSFWLLRFAVDPQLPNSQEIAATLAQKAREIAAERGHDSIVVYTDVDDPSLNRRYEELGFHKANNYRCYWKEAA